MLDELYNNPDDPELDTPPSQAELNENYGFADGNLAPSEQLDAFMAEFEQEKEEKDCPLEPLPEDLEENEPEDEEEISNQTARNTAQFIVATIDEGASTGLSYLSKDPQDNFRAGKEQRKNLENLFTKFCKEKGTEIPIQWQIFFCIATVYCAKIPYALDRRALNKEREEIERERKALMEDRQRLDEEQKQVENERRTIRKIRSHIEDINAGTD